MDLSNPCRAREPQVIDNELLLKCTYSQLPKGQVGRLMLDEGIQLDHLEEMRLEFMNIIKMDHLWVLKSLVKLKLNNNYIEKIENLETLIHLEELDLSFNKITKIENLNTLVKLRKLNLYDNLIEKIENVSALRDLSIFSIGRNKIENREEIHTLRRLEKLVSLNMARNPCTEQADLLLYVAAMLPQLVYYEYKRIKDDVKASGKALFQQNIIDVEAKEERELKKILQKEREDREAILNMDSFVEYLNTRNLFDQMYEGDAEGHLLLNLGDDVKNMYDTFEVNFINCCREAFDIGQKHYKIRKEDIDSFKESTDEAKKENQLESIKHMEEFVEAKNEIRKKGRAVQRQLFEVHTDELTFKTEIEELSNDLDTLIHSTWKKLMKLELHIYEQMDDVNQTFEHNLAEMINNFIEESQNCFTQLRALENAYNDQLTEFAMKMIQGIGIAEDLEIPEVLAEVMSDKDNLLNCLGATHDVHLLVIDNREDVLINRSKSWLADMIKNLHETEIRRNRYKILEISHFFDLQREEFDEFRNVVITSNKDTKDLF